jgi:hypothetical protein
MSTLFILFFQYYMHQIIENNLRNDFFPSSMMILGTETLSRYWRRRLLRIFVEPESHNFGGAAAVMRCGSGTGYGFDVEKYVKNCNSFVLFLFPFAIIALINNEKNTVL